jgi:hypothetical protein
MYVQILMYGITTDNNLCKYIHLIQLKHRVNTCL